MQKNNYFCEKLQNDIDFQRLKNSYSVYFGYKFVARKPDVFALRMNGNKLTLIENNILGIKVLIKSKS